MEECKSGQYVIKDQQIVPVPNRDMKIGTMLYKSKDFSHVDITPHWEGMIIWVFHTPINLDIEVFAPAGMTLEEIHNNGR